jgi:drug/metabolite transporter (DMT)-like permease
VTRVWARLALVVGTAMWGLTFTANHQLLRTLTPAEITALRFAMVGAVLVTLLVARPALRPRFTRRQWLVVMVCGVLAVPGAQLALTHGQQYLSPSMSGLVAAAGPAFAALLAVVVLAERLRPRGWLGIVIAFLGSATVVVFTSGAGTDLTVHNPAGAALVALAQLCWAGYTVLSKRLVRSSAPLTVVATAVLIGVLTMAPAAPGAVRAVGGLAVTDWGWLVHLAVLGTLLPYIIWSTALRHLQANETAVFMFLIPLFAGIWSAVLLGERPSAVGLVGGAAIVVGVALTQTAGVGARPAPPVAEGVPAALPGEASPPQARGVDGNAPEG